ncbi:Truncated polyprotein 1aTF [Bienertia sinuspersici]
MGHHACICYTEKEGRKPGQVWRRKAKETELETTNFYPQEDNAKDKQKRGQAPDYKDRVNRAWQWKGQGTKMYGLTTRLKQVKKELKDLNKNGFSSIQAAATKAYQELTDVQQALHANPRDARLATVEKEALNHYKKKQEIYVQFLK